MQRIPQGVSITIRFQNWDSRAHTPHTTPSVTCQEEQTWLRFPLSSLGRGLIRYPPPPMLHRYWPTGHLPRKRSGSMRFHTNINRDSSSFAKTYPNNISRWILTRLPLSSLPFCSQQFLLNYEYHYLFLERRTYKFQMRPPQIWI